MGDEWRLDGDEQLLALRLEGGHLARLLRVEVTLESREKEEWMVHSLAALAPVLAGVLHVVQDLRARGEPEALLVKVENEGSVPGEKGSGVSPREKIDDEARDTDAQDDVGLREILADHPLEDGVLAVLVQAAAGAPNANADGNPRFGVGAVAQALADEGYSLLRLGEGLRAEDVGVEGVGADAHKNQDVDS